MRDADQYLADAELFDVIASAAAPRNHRTSVGLVAHFDIAPTDAASPAGAERLEHGFFGRPPTGVVLRGRLPQPAVLDLVVGIDAVNEQLTMPLDHLRDPQAFDDIGADSEYVH